MMPERPYDRVRVSGATILPSPRFWNNARPRRREYDQSTALTERSVQGGWMEGVRQPWASVVPSPTHQASALGT